MIDHLTLTVRDVARSKAFYQQALAPLGYSVQMEFDPVCALGPAGKPCFWLRPGEPPTQPIHLAFMAKDRPSVDAFHAAALAAGATDNGAPGLRPHYHPNYYASFVFDLDGHNVEAVCHAPAAFAVKPKRAARPAARGARSARPAARKAGRKPAPKKKPKARSRKGR